MLSVCCPVEGVVEALFVWVWIGVESEGLMKTVAPDIGLLLLSTTLMTAVTRPGSDSGAVAKA